MVAVIIEGAVIVLVVAAAAAAVGLAWDLRRERALRRGQLAAAAQRARSRALETERAAAAPLTVCAPMLQIVAELFLVADEALVRGTLHVGGAALRVVDVELIAVDGGVVGEGVRVTARPGVPTPFSVWVPARLVWGESPPRLAAGIALRARTIDGAVAAWWPAPRATTPGAAS